MHCASCIGHKNHVIRRISARILRTRYYSWTSTVGDLYFFSNTLIDTLKLEKLKKFIKKKKIWLKPCTKPVTRWCNHDLENNDSRNVLSRSCLKLDAFSSGYMSNFSMRSRDFIPIKFFFFGVTLKPLLLATTKCTVNRWNAGNEYINRVCLVSTLQIVRFMKLSFLSIIIETEKINFHKVFTVTFVLILW